MRRFSTCRLPRYGGKLRHKQANQHLVTICRPLRIQARRWIYSTRIHATNQQQLPDLEGLVHNLSKTGLFVPSNSTKYTKSDNIDKSSQLEYLCNKIFTKKCKTFRCHDKPVFFQSVSQCHSTPRSTNNEISIE